MRRTQGSSCAAALVLAAAACGSPEAPSIAWARWFSFQSIEDLSVAPEGDVVLVGEDTLDDAGSSFAVGPRGGWLMRIDAAGEVQSSWNGFVGAPVAVAAGDDDAYVVLAGVRDPAVSDDAVLGACHIVAMDANAEVRWTTTWDRMDEQSRCPSALALVDGTLVARSGPALVGFSATDGVQVWEQTGLPWSPRNALAVVGSDVWMVGVRVGSDDAWPVAMRIRADDGELAEIALADPEWGLGAFTVGPQEIVMLQDGGNPLRPDVRLAAFGRDGTTRWVEPLATALDPAAGSRRTCCETSSASAAWLRNRIVPSGSMISAGVASASRAARRVPASTL